MTHRLTSPSSPDAVVALTAGARRDMPAAEMTAMLPPIQRTLVVGGLIALAACAAATAADTTFKSSWLAPDANALRPFAGQKIVAMVMSKSIAVRRSAEDALAAAVTAQGAPGVAAYTLVDDSITNDEPKARAAIEASGAVGVVVMRPVSKGQEVSVTSSMYMGPSYGPYWGGYYGYGWGAAWVPDIRVDTVITVETLAYSLKQNKIVWGSQSVTTTSKSINTFIRQLAADAAKEMKRAGLL